MRWAVLPSTSLPTGERRRRPTQITPSVPCATWMTASLGSQGGFLDAQGQPGGLKRYRLLSEHLGCLLDRDRVAAFGSDNDDRRLSAQGFPAAALRAACPGGVSA